MEKTPLSAIRFAYTQERAYNAILWLLHQHGGTLKKLKLVKLVFLADLEHLVRYGRPIVGGDYVAMPHGPVASSLLNDINSSGLNNPPFRLISQYDVGAIASVDEDQLSESDMEVLREVNTQFGDMDQFKLRDLTHNYEAWKKNYLGNNSSYPLPYEDFFLNIPDDRQEMLDIIRDRQEAWALLT